MWVLFLGKEVHTEKKGRNEGERYREVGVALKESGWKGGGIREVAVLGNILVNSLTRYILPA